MKDCKKCKLYKKEKDLEKYLVHLVETHGFRKETLKEKFIKLVDINRFEELWKEHRRTGQRSALKLFGKPPKRII